jgi:hypothetical protein
MPWPVNDGTVTQPAIGLAPGARPVDSKIVCGDRGAAPRVEP